MRSTEPGIRRWQAPSGHIRWHAWLRSATVAALAGCSSPMPPYRPAPLPVPPVAPVQAPPAGTAVTSSPTPKPPVEARTWDEYRRQAAERIIAANPQSSYLGTVPDNLLAIPVLEIEVNRDGSIRRIEVLRNPRQALDTTQLAIDAVQRAAPFGSVSRLPRPWKFTETFLFNDDRRFKPRTLD